MVRRCISQIYLCCSEHVVLILCYRFNSSIVNPGWIKECFKEHPDYMVCKLNFIT